MRWTRRRFLAAAAAVPVGAAACADGTRTGAGGGEPSGLHAYGDDPSQVAELRLPPGDGPHPVVVLLHGGFWRAQYDRHLMDDLAADLVHRGWAAWNVEYRRVGQDGGGWPGTFADVAAAVDALADLAGSRPDAGRGPDAPVDSEAGPTGSTASSRSTGADSPAAAAPLDLGRVVTVGHSAGGHLALWAAGRHRLPAGAVGADPVVRPAGAVSQAGVADLVVAAEQQVGGTAVPDLLGGRPGDVPERYATCSPTALLPLGVPSLCVHGRDDDIVPIDQSERWVEAATAAGDAAELAAFDGGHFEVLDPAHRSWQAVVERLDGLATPRR